MKTASLQTVARKMKDLDLCMLVTADGRGTFHSRPMSNNGKVDYDGDSWFFTYEDSNKVRQIQAHPNVSLIFQAAPALFIECYGRASIVMQRSKLEEKWLPELEQWFPQGLETPGLCLIRVKAARVQFWDKGEEGEYKS